MTQSTNRPAINKFMFAIGILLAVMIGFFASRAFSAEPLAIVSNGATAYVIAVPDNATEVEQTAATELQTYLMKVSGVNLPIVSESAATGNAFWIGATAFASTHGIQPSDEEQWAVKTAGDHIVINGGGLRGTLYGVYHFLEDVIGVRWWNVWEEYVPDKDVIEVGALDLSGKPAFKYRDIYINAPGYISPDTYIVNDPDIIKDVGSDHSNFYVRNRMNGQFGFAPAAYGGTFSIGPPYFVHTAGWYFHKDKYLSTNPEYFATVNGVAGEQLCLANTGLQAAYADKVIDFIEIAYEMADEAGLPRPYMFDISQNDAHGGVCPGWEQYDDATKNIMFVNSVAEKVAVVYPDVKITTLAYMHYIGIPSVEPRDNVVIRFADLEKDNLHSINHPNNSNSLSLLQGWSGISDELMIWEYGVDYQANGPLPSMYTLKEDYLKYKSLGLTGIFIEDPDPIAKDMWDMKVWMQAKLMENPELDVRTLMEDFAYGYYGAAGNYVLEYLDLTRDLADATSQRNDYYTTRAEAFSYFTLDYVAEAQSLLDAAELAVENDPVYLRRLNHARSALDRLIILKYMDLAKEASENGTDLHDENISRKASATRLVQMLRDQKALRFEISNTLQLPYTYAGNANAEITLYESYASLEDPIYTEAVDGVYVYTASDLRLWMQPGYGLSIVEDELSSTKSAVKVNFADLESARRALHETMGSGGTMPVGIYNVNAATDEEKGLKLDLSTPSYSYKMYKIYDDRIFTPSDFIHINHAWVIQKDIDAVIANSSDKYDVYLSLRFTGPTFGATGDDALYIDKLVFVKDTGAELPEQLADIPTGDIREFTALEYTLYTVYGGLKLVNDEDSARDVAVKISLDQITDGNYKNHHYITAERPMTVGLYDLATTNARTIGNIARDDLLPDEYKLYKIDSVAFNPKEYMYLFGSWSVQLLLDAALKEDPNQLYDIYISMKVEGPSYGGNSADDDAIYIDRIFAVKKEPEIELSSPANVEGTAASTSVIDLIWTASPASENVTGYNVYRDGVLAGSVTGATYQDTGLSPNTTYAYYVTSYDAQGKESAASATVSIKTKEPEVPPQSNGGTVVPSAPANQTTIAAGKAGEVSLGKAITVSIPAGSSAAELVVSITEVAGTQQLLSGMEAPISSIFEVLKNRTGNFKSPVTIAIAFDPEKLKAGQQPSIFFYDEVAGSWVDIGGEVSGSVVSARVDHFTKFAVFAVDATTVTEEPKPETLFKDIANHWASIAIQRAAALGVINGYTDGTFRPNNEISRAEFVSMLMQMMKFPEQPAAKSFSDLGGAAWAEKAIVQAAQLGIVSGDKDGKFRPNESITRAQIAVMIANALKAKQKAATGSAAAKFADEQVIPAWAKQAVQTVADAGIMNGRSQKLFVPQGTATRAEAVVVLLRLLDLNA